MNTDKAARDGALGIAMLAVIQLADAAFDWHENVELALLSLGLVAVPFAWRIARRRWPWLDPTEPSPPTLEEGR